MESFKDVNFFRTFICLLGIAFMIWIALDTMKRPEQLVSAAGYLACLLLLFITSVKPSHVDKICVFYRNRNLILINF